MNTDERIWKKLTEIFVSKIISEFLPKCNHFFLFMSTTHVKDLTMGHTQKHNLTGVCGNNVLLPPGGISPDSECQSSSKFRNLYNIGT